MKTFGYSPCCAVIVTFLTVVKATYFKTQLQALRRTPVYYPYRQMTRNRLQHKWIPRQQPVRKMVKECCPGYEGRNCEKLCFTCDQYHKLRNQVTTLERELRNKGNTTTIITGRGRKGEPGFPGPPGPRGPEGETGLVGLPGQKGDPGVPGPPGFSGERGKDGLPGEPGKQGSKGNPGAIGPSGPPGLPGSDGIRGPPGVSGLKGEKGDAAEDGITVDQYTFLVEKIDNFENKNGLPGKEGPQGPPGPPGPEGLQGQSGIPGVKGNPGERGFPGERGPQGSIGLPGERGRDGRPGSKGERGEAGLPGAPGPMGPTGTTGITGEPGRPGNPGLPGPQGEKGEASQFPISVAEYKLLVNRVEELEKTVAICCAPSTTPLITTTQFQCESNQHQCGGTNPRCIPQDFVCDGLGDCDDQSDESPDLCGKTRPTCPEGLFACNNGQCVRSDAKCNGAPDCADLSDEANCPENTHTLVIEIFGEKVDSSGEDTDAPAPKVNKTEYGLIGRRINFKEENHNKSTDMLDKHIGKDLILPPPPIPKNETLRKTLLTHVRNMSESSECRSLALEYYRNEHTDPRKEETLSGANLQRSHRVESVQFVITNAGVDKSGGMFLILTFFLVCVM